VVAELEFKYKDQEAPVNAVSRLSAGMQLYRPEHFVSGPYLCSDYNPELITKCMQHLTPENMNLLVYSPTLEDKTTESEKVCFVLLLLLLLFCFSCCCYVFFLFFFSFLSSPSSMLGVSSFAHIVCSLLCCFSISIASVARSSCSGMAPSTPRSNSAITSWNTGEQLR
jgi:Middle or third domain of peptidase_M16